jgi:hypothetical protein
MVALEPSKPLQLYIAATSEAVSMVLVTEQPDPHDLHELRSSSANGLGFQDSGPTEEPGATDGSGSQDSGPAEEPEADVAARSQSLEAAMPPLTRGSWCPQVQSSRQIQRVGSSLGLHQCKWTCRTPRTVQRPVYFISEVLHEAKTRYLEVHKLLYAVLITSRKLRHYFQAHRISVVTSYPLRAILRNPNMTANIAKWAAELAEFELDFVPRHVVKSQVLANFIVDWTPSACPLGVSDGSEPELRAPVFTGTHWTLFFDVSSHKQWVSVGVLLLAPHGDQIKYMVHLNFKATNNMAEYEALLFALSTALSLGSDSST